MISYRLDKSNVILSLKGDWDAFSTQNGGPSNSAERYVGRPLWDFVSGFETQSFLNTLTFFARQQNQPVSIGYRCDSMDVARAFKMEITPAQDGVLTVAHRPLVIPTPVTDPDVADLNNRREHTLTCSQCLRVQRNGTWLEAFGVRKGTGFLVRYTICPDCRDIADQKMSEDRGIVRIFGT
ncbi:hypothetical protein AIOL_001444 [Candidatus Rhodobacter oscarellae]|uniref:Uncharacterized protein n=1 Tax=Candidatus Rhodobacter oscarellae TaxID=1675527 RepID=A0A0J9E176_9RHOB|nr:hypothetical protein [Candidatus Rhodobacter lobularis]KMW56490.1 hypothetical protein AIOL_001444 [Candidatus Rhodobacter lobularis]